VVAEQPGLGFAELLRQLRAEARLTQEELAEAAGLSPRSVSDLERGIHQTARKDTAGLLAGALGLAEPVRALFVAAARGRAPAAEVLTALRAEAAPAAPGGAMPPEPEGAPSGVVPRQLPAGAAFFVGREVELKQLDALPGSAGLNGGEDGPGGAVVISAVAGMAGVGKTALAVH
jgi:transcriptional regulator with XRE-family HTH domain